MKSRLFPTFATFAVLALAAVAPAQDRGRRDRGGDRGSSTSRSGGDRSGDRSRTERTDRGGTDRGGDSRRNDPPKREEGRDSRPSRNDAPRRDDSRDTKPADSRPPSSPDRSRDRNDRDSRPTNGSDRTRDRDTRPGNDRTGGDRPNTTPDRSRDRDNRQGEGRPTNDQGRNDRSGDRNDRDRNPGSRPNNDRGNDNRNDRDARPSRSDNARRDPFDRSSRNGGNDRNGWNDRRDDRPGGWNGNSSRAWGRNRPSYSAPSHYDGRGRYDRPVRFGAPPIRTTINVNVRNGGGRRGSDFAFGGIFGGLRVGYVSYGRQSAWSVGLGFGYGHYAYDPYAGLGCVASPWYRYSYLPPYIQQSQVVVVNNYPDRWGYDGWRTVDYRDDQAVGGALDDLRDGFENRDDRVAGRLVPEGGQVAIFNEGRYDYSLGADDFEKMFLDGVDESKTVRYEVLEVRTRGDEARVRARHEYEDSWGERQSVVHTITLRRDRGGDYVIREFGTE